MFRKDAASDTVSFSNRVTTAMYGKQYSDLKDFTNKDIDYQEDIS